MRSYVYRYVQVAGRTTVYSCVALASDYQNLRIVDSCGDIDFLLACAANLSLAAAGATGLFDDLSATAALVAGTLCLHLTKGCTLNDLYVTGTMTGRTRLWRGAVGGTRTVTIGTAVDGCNLDLLFTALCRFLKGNGDRSGNVSASSGRIRVGSTAAESATKDARENIANVSKVAEATEAAAKSASAVAACRIVRVDTCVTELVVTGPFFLVGKDFVGLVHLFKPSFRLFIAGIKVGVILFCRLSICLF